MSDLDAVREEFIGLTGKDPATGQLVPPGSGSGDPVLEGFANIYEQTMGEPLPAANYDAAAADIERRKLPAPPPLTGIVVNDAPTGVTPRAQPLAEPQEFVPSTAFGRTLDDGTWEPGYVQAAFGLENDVVAGIDFMTRPRFAYDENYTVADIAEALKGTEFENDLEPFYNDRNMDETLWRAEQIRKEMELRDIAARGGIGGTVSMFAASAASPTVFVPVAGWAGFAAKTGRAASVAAGVVEGAIATGAAVAAQEGILQATQQTRTATETAWNVGLATLLGGVLGGGVGYLTSRQLDAAARKLDAMPGTRAEEEQAFNSLVNSSAGAQQVTAGRGSSELKGALGSERLFGQPPIFAGQDPLIRLQTSPIKSARDTVRDLAETPLTLAENAEGIPTTIGGSVETRIKMAEGPLARAIKSADDTYKAYVRGGGKLSRAEFDEEVFDAMLNGDVHPTPEVQQAAKAYRELVFDPLKNEAIEVKLFAEDIKPLDDVGYVPRVYNTEIIAARRPQFIDILTQHFVSRQEDILARLDDLQARSGAPDVATDLKIADMTRDELKSVAEEVTDTILGNAPGRMLLPGDIVQGPRGPLKERVLRIPTSLIRDFVERNPEVLARHYSRTMAADVNLVRKFGSTDLAEQIRKINDESTRLSEGAKSERARLKITGPRGSQQRAIKDIEGIRDRLRGVYAIPREPHGLITRAGRIARNVNYVRLLGGMTLSAIPDLAQPVMKHGLLRVFRDGFLPLVTNLKTYKLAANEAKLAGTALDMVLDSRVMAIADVMDDYGRGSRFERGLQATTRKFGVISLMSPWNAAMKQFAGVVTQTRMLQEMEKVVSGKATKKMVEYLAAGGIDANTAERIVKQFRAHGAKDGGAWFANTSAWKDRNAIDAYRAMLVREVDRIIVTPGQDKPLWMSTELGKTIGQFKSFSVSTVQRTLISGLQQRDMAALNGTMLMLGLGAVAYWAKSTTSGYDVSDKPEKWAVEAIDRSGLIGWLSDANNFTEKATRGRVGLSAITGEVSSRYASRNISGAALGPTADVMQDLFEGMGAAFAGDWKASDTHRLRKMLPLQNVFYMRQLFDAAERGANDAMGVKDTRR